MQRSLELVVFNQSSQLLSSEFTEILSQKIRLGSNKGRHYTQLLVSHVHADTRFKRKVKVTTRSTWDIL